MTPSAFSALSIIVSEHAVTNERLFPASRHRSKRVHKKLLKRFGAETRMVPAAWQTPSGLVMHPDLHADMMKRIKP